MLLGRVRRGSLLMQVKEAQPSVLEKYLAQSVTLMLRSAWSQVSD
jgi:hypothetical protein